MKQICCHHSHRVSGGPSAPLAFPSSNRLSPLAPWLLVLVALAGSSHRSCAQSNTPAPTIANRPVLVAPTTPPDRPNLPPRPDRPTSPGQPPPPAGMQDLVRDFQSARQAFLKEQKELNQRLAAATAEQRQAVRAEFKERLQRWREFQKTQILEMREQAKETLKNTPQDIAREPQDGSRGR